RALTSPLFPYTTLFRSDPAVTAGALGYLVVSTLGIAALFLVAGLTAPEGDEEEVDALQLEPYEPPDSDGRTDELYAEEDESRVVDRKSTRLNSSHVKIS